MRLEKYFSRIEEIEQTIDTPFVSIVSEQTSDGGRAGVVSEVSRETAARLVAEGRARIASPAESRQYREQAQRAFDAARNVPSAKICDTLARPDEQIRPERRPVRPGKG